jgi:hypothetical protein
VSATLVQAAAYRQALSDLHLLVGFIRGHRHAQRVLQEHILVRYGSHAIFLFGFLIQMSLKLGRQAVFSNFFGASALDAEVISSGRDVRVTQHLLALPRWSGPFLRGVCLPI